MSLGSCGIANLAILQLGKFSGGGGEGLFMGELGLQGKRGEFRSSRRYFKTLSLDELRSLDFNLLSDEEYSEEEMAETMEQYMSKTPTDYRSGVARPKIDNKDQFELKGHFLKEL
ncbi:hypothetical protein Tco_1183030 [Tanacetum coccineum]